MDAEELLAVGRRTLLERRGVVACEADALVDDPARRVLTWPGRLLAEVLRVVLGEVLAPTGADQQRVPAAYLDPLGLRRLLEMRGGDLEARRERVGPAARDLPRDVQKHDAVHHQIGREAVDAEIVADAARRRRRGDRVDTAVELQVPSDVADRVDGGRAVLAAEVHDLRRPGHAASRHLAEDLVGHAMGPVERERVRRVEAEDGRLLVPGEREVEQARAPDRSHELVGRGAALRSGRPGRRRRDAEGSSRPEPLSSGHVVHSLFSSCSAPRSAGPQPRDDLRRAQPDEFAASVIGVGARRKNHAVNLPKPVGGPR